MPPGEPPELVEPEQPALSKPDDDNETATDDGPLPSAKPPLIRIHDVVGTTPAEAGIMFADATEAMERCKTTETGTLRIHLTGEGERARMTVNPDSTVDSKTSGCVLRALSIADFTDAAEQSTAPSESPRRFESQLTINWR